MQGRTPPSEHRVTVHDRQTAFDDTLGQDVGSLMLEYSLQHMLHSPQAHRTYKQNCRVIWSSHWYVNTAGVG